MQLISDLPEKLFKNLYINLPSNKTAELLEKTLFIVRDPQLLPHLSHLPHVSHATPPAHSNSSLTYKATILANLAQMQMRILVWSHSLPLARSPLELFDSKGGADLVAGRCGGRSHPSLDLVLLQPTFPAYNFLSQLGLPYEGKSEANYMRSLLQQLQIGEHSLRWRWTKKKFCDLTL